jgi:hypothetical protein
LENKIPCSGRAGNKNQQFFKEILRIRHVHGIDLPIKKQTYSLLSGKDWKETDGKIKIGL